MWSFDFEKALDTNVYSLWSTSDCSVFSAGLLEWNHVEMFLVLVEFFDPCLLCEQTRVWIVLILVDEERSEFKKDKVKYVEGVPARSILLRTFGYLLISGNPDWLILPKLDVISNDQQGLAQYLVLNDDGDDTRCEHSTPSFETIEAVYSCLNRVWTHH